ncbi:MAG: BLUF domain-containing protein [Methylotetracoccus sp.]
MSLCSLIYVSQAAKPMSDDDLKILLQFARQKNERLGITGMLLYRDGFFMQALEGQHETVDALFERIRQDPRHRDVLRIYRDPVKARSFPDWTMGFNKVDDETLVNMEGFTEFMDHPNPGFFHGEPARAKALLDNFRNHIFF